MFSGSRAQRRIFWPRNGSGCFHKIATVPVTDFRKVDPEAFRPSDPPVQALENGLVGIVWHFTRQQLCVQGRVVLETIGACSCGTQFSLSAREGRGMVVCL
jgi:hypothetical protein